MRTYTQFVSTGARHLLEVLIDEHTAPPAYQKAMTELGQEMASTIAAHKLPHEAATKPTVCIVCTVEDADFLARGLLDGLLAAGVGADQVKLMCFWNERVSNFPGSSGKDFDVAPAVKQYREAVDLSHAVVIVLKSIISGACVVKTNLATLIQEAVPSKVIVAAPVMLKGAEEKLAEEFPRSISDRFEYVTFAVDDKKVGDNVEPGIGGVVYDRLGFVDKNTYVPQLVQERRRAARSAAH